MAVRYDSENGVNVGPSEHFTNTLFLEFMNRILALVFAAVILLVRRQPAHTAPMYKYSYNALSNVMSSWCQYEALKYILFPVQVLILIIIKFLIPPVVKVIIIIIIIIICY